MNGGKLVVVALGSEEFGLRIEHVREITRIGEVRPIPDAPSYIQGLINLRGQAIPLISLHTRFGSSDADSVQSKRNTFALITEHENNLVALSVDEVREVRDIASIDPSPPLVKVSFITGIINLQDRIIMILDLPKMLSDTGLEELTTDLQEVAV